MQKGLIGIVIVAVLAGSVEARNIEKMPSLKENMITKFMSKKRSSKLLQLKKNKLGVVTGSAKKLLKLRSTVQRSLLKKALGQIKKHRK